MSLQSVDVLDRCISDVKSGLKTVEDCIAEYPEHRADIERLLPIALAIRAPEVSLEPNRKLQARHAFVEALAAESQPTQGWMSWLPFRATPSRLRLAAVAVNFVGALIITSSIAAAAKEALPGDPLYPLKTTLEQVQLATTFSPDAKAQVNLEHGQERLAEVQKAVDSGKPKAAATAAAAAAASIQQAQQDIDAAQANGKPVDDLRERLEAQAQRTDQVLAQVPGPAAQPTPATMSARPQPQAAPEPAVTEPPAAQPEMSVHDEAPAAVTQENPPPAAAEEPSVPVAVASPVESQPDASRPDTSGVAIAPTAGSLATPATGERSAPSAAARVDLTTRNPTATPDENPREFRPPALPTTPIAIARPNQPPFSGAAAAPSSAAAAAAAAAAGEVVSPADAPVATPTRTEVPPTRTPTRTATASPTGTAAPSQTPTPVPTFRPNGGGGGDTAAGTPGPTASVPPLVQTPQAEPDQGQPTPGHRPAPPTSSPTPQPTAQPTTAH